MGSEEEILVEKMVDRVRLGNTRVSLYGKKISRNDPCPCGSGKKYKNCCIEKDKDKLYGVKFQVKRLVKEKKQKNFKIEGEN